MKYAIEKGVREKRASGAFEISKTACRYVPVKRPDEDALRLRIIEHACQYGRVGYRMVTALMRNEGLQDKGDRRQLRTPAR